MPFETDTPLRRFEQQANVANKPDVFDQAAAALDEYNATYNLARTQPLPSFGKVGSEGFDQYDVLPKLTENERANASAFALVKSDEDLAEVRRRIDVERKNKEVLRDGPLNETMLALTSGFLDPVNYLPAFGPLNRARSGALSLGASAVVSAGIAEGILQGRQYERSATESWASILMAAGIGGTLGAAAGAWSRPLMAPAAIVEDVGGMIRSTGLAGPSPLRADLMGSTALAQFLDVQPRFKLNPVFAKQETVDILNAMSHADNAVLNRINTAATRVEAATDRLRMFDNENLAEAGFVDDRIWSGRNAFDRYISAHRRAMDDLATLENSPEYKSRRAEIERAAKANAAEGRPSDVEGFRLSSLNDQIARERDAIMENFKDVEAMAKREGITTREAFKRAIEALEKKKDEQWGVAARDRAVAELDAAVAEHEAAQKALAKAVDQWREKMTKISAQMGAKGRAHAAADILRQRDELTKYLGENGDPIKLKKPDPLAWLEGIAKNPALSKVDEVVEGAAPVAPKEGEAKSLSAAAVPPVDHTVWKLANSFKVADTMAKLKKVGLAAPSLELATSIFSTANRVVHQIVNTGMMTKGNLLGMANPKNMHTEIKRMSEPDIMNIAKSVEAGWKDYVAEARAAGVQPIKKNEFYKQISYAMRRGDKSPIKEVEAVAAKLREIDTKYRDLMIEWDVGVFKGAMQEEVSINPDGSLVVKKTVKAPTVGKTAESHYLRSYNDPVLRARQTEFIEMATDYFERQALKDAGMVVRDGMLVKVGKAGGKDAKTGKDVPATKDEVVGRAGGEDDPRLGADELARSVYHTILSHPESRLPFQIKVAEGRGSAKERTFNIRDDFVSSKGVRFEDFLDNNPINVMFRYVKTAASDVAYQMAIGGDDGLKVVLKELQTEADAMAAELGVKDSTRIVRQYEHEAHLIRALIEQVRGTTSKAVDPRMDAFNRTLKGVRSFQAIRNLGSVIFSQLPDLGGAVISEGFGRVFGGAITEFASGFKGIRLGMQQAQMFGTATDMSLMGRTGQMFDLGETYRNTTKFEAMLERGTHFMMNLYGIGPWTAGMKGLISYLGGHSILDGVERLATGREISDTLRKQLARDGIGVEQAKRIYAQKDFWVKHRGLWLSGAQDWTDIEAKNLFGNALLQRVDNAIITPNAGDAPLWTSNTEIGKSLFQFKRFAWASNQRLLVAGLQQGDHQAFSGMAAAFGMALLGTALRDISQRGSVKERTPAQWAREAWDRSGLTSIFMEMENVFDKASGGHGPIHMLTGSQPQRFAATGLLERIGGPSVGMLADTSRALSGVADGTLTGQDVHNMMRLIPGNNFPATRYVMDQIEQGLVNGWGLPPRQQR